MTQEKCWWDKKWGNESICGITLTRLRPGMNANNQSKAVFLPCGHGFVRNALKDWCKKQGNCPICRKKIPNYLLKGIAKDGHNGSNQAV